MWLVYRIYYVVLLYIEAMISRVREHGGQVHRDVFSPGGIGKLAVVADPAGATVTLIEHSGKAEEWVE